MVVPTYTVPLTLLWGVHRRASSYAKKVCVMQEPNPSVHTLNVINGRPTMGKNIKDPTIADVVET